MSEAAADLPAGLPAHDRQLVRDMAAAAGCAADQMAAAIIAGYLDLYRDAPSALPPNPLRSLAIAARKKEVTS